MPDHSHRGPCESARTDAGPREHLLAAENATTDDIAGLLGRVQGSRGRQFHKPLGTELGSWTAKTVFSARAPSPPPILKESRWGLYGVMAISTGRDREDALRRNVVKFQEVRFRGGGALSLAVWLPIDRRQGVILTVVAGDPEFSAGQLSPQGRESIHRCTVVPPRSRRHRLRRVNSEEFRVISDGGSKFAATETDRD